MAQIQEPVSFDHFKSFHNLDEKGITHDESQKRYSRYLSEIEGENKCGRETKHRNQKWNGGAGCYVCLDCGAWYV